MDYLTWIDLKLRSERQSKKRAKQAKEEELYFPPKGDSLHFCGLELDSELDDVLSTWRTER